MMRCSDASAATSPLPGRCTSDKVVYRATVSSGTSVETYVGLTVVEFKDRFYKNDSDFREPGQKNSTKLSAYIWKLKEEQKTYNIKWDIVTRAMPYSAVSRKCNLCTAEKFEIIFNPKLATLNSRHKLYSHCRHKRKLYLVKNKR